MLHPSALPVKAHWDAITSVRSVRWTVCVVPTRCLAEYWLPISMLVMMRWH